MTGPVDTFREAAPLLRRPFTPAAVRFKPQAVLGDGKGVLCVAYIDARLVIERLNLIVPHLWHDSYRPVGDGLMWCDLTIDAITRSDVGEGTGKALVSDALKRAAVHFGVGVSLYAIPQQRIWATDARGSLVTLWRKSNGKGWDARLEDAGHAHLRRVYSTWLDEHGTSAFGAPLDHGDVDDHQGDPDTDPTPADKAQVVDQRTGEIVDPAEQQFREQQFRESQLRESLVSACRQALDTGVWTLHDLRAQLEQAGATSISSVRAAVASMPRGQAERLHATISDLLAAHADRQATEFEQRAMSPEGTVA